MAMAILRYRFDPAIDEPTWRARLRDEIGRRASARNVETTWLGDGALEVLSQDAIAIVYASKVSRALGGEPVAPTTARSLPAWATARWVDLPLWTRFRIWLGPTQL